MHCKSDWNSISRFMNERHIWWYKCVWCVCECVIFRFVFIACSVRLMCTSLYNSQPCYNFVYLYAGLMINSIITKKDTFTSTLLYTYDLHTCTPLFVSFSYTPFINRYIADTLHKHTNTNTIYATIPKSVAAEVMSDSSDIINEKVIQYKPRWVFDSILTE